MEKVINISIKGVVYFTFTKENCKWFRFFNDFLNCSSLPQLHWPGYNYLGPGTKLEKDYKPINKLDEAARDHDYFYKKHKDTTTRHIF